MIFGFWFLRERPRRIDWITMVVIFGGMLLFFGEGLTLEGLYGNLAAVLGGVALAIMIVSARAQVNNHPAQIFLIGSMRAYFWQRYIWMLRANCACPVKAASTSAQIVWMETPSAS